MTTNRIVGWLLDSPVSRFINSEPWAWPCLEIAHFFSLCVLFGSLAVIDLRLAGFGPPVADRVGQLLVRTALVAFGVNALTGALFFTANAPKYIDNPAFELKLVLIGLAGLNAALYHWRFRPLLTEDRVTVLAQLSGVASILLWSSVIVCGRMITFFAR